MGALRSSGALFWGLLLLGSSSQLQVERALVGHVNRLAEVYWLRQLRKGLPGRERCSGWIFPDLGGTLSRIGLRH